MLNSLEWIFSVKMCRRCLFGLLVLIGAGLVSGDHVKRKVGDEAKFKPDNFINTDFMSSITWKHKSTAGKITKVIEWDSYDKVFESPNVNFKDHATLNKTTGELTLKNLRLMHSGLYTIEIKSQEQEKKITLTVMEGVIKPVLKLEPPNNPENPHAFYLICEYNETISLTCSNGEKFPITPLDGPRKGQSLTFIKTGNPEVCCTCTLTNAVSEETSDPLCEKDLFPEKSIVGVGLGFLSFFICIFILIIAPISVLIILYLYIDSFHDRVHFSCKDTPFIRDVLGRLDSYRSKTRQQKGQVTLTETGAVKTEGGAGDKEGGAKANGDDGMMKNAGPGETEEEKVELMTGPEA